MGNKDQPAPERVRPRAGATRCPYCRDECDPSLDVAVCRECLSRHHRACWDEAGACSSCTATEALTPEEATVAESTRNLFENPVALAGLLFAEGTITFFVLVFVVPAFRRMFEETGIDLPTLTRWVIGASDSWLLACLAIMGVCAFAVRFKVKSSKGAGLRLALMNGLLMGSLVLALVLPLIVLIEKL